MKRDFVIMEMDPEFPIVGVISGVINNTAGQISFRERLIEACRAHFDGECKIVHLDSIWENGKTPTAVIWVEGGYGKVELRIFQTLIYRPWKYIR